MTPIRERLDQTPLYGVAGTYGYAIVPVTVQGVTDDGKPSGPVVSERAVIDTGSTDTTIDPGVIMDLSLTQVGITTAQDGLTDKREVAPVYRICLTIPQLERQWGDQGDLYAPARTVDLPMPEGAPYKPPSFRVLIGTDLLQSCRFTYNDPPGWFVLESLGQ
jgi:hypothetical protein